MTMWMWTTLSLTLTILALIICCGLLVKRHFALLERLLAEEKTTNRALLGLPSPVQTAPTLMQQSQPSLTEPAPDPLAEFESLSPEIQANLLREYEEAMAVYPKNLTAHPDVPQIIPGQAVPVS